MLKLKAPKVTAELLKLAKKAVPIEAASATGSADSAREHSNGSGSGSGCAEPGPLSGVMVLPPAVLQRVQLLLMAAENKFRSYDQVRP